MSTTKLFGIELCPGIVVCRIFGIELCPGIVVCRIMSRYSFMQNLYVPCLLH